MYCESQKLFDPVVASFLNKLHDKTLANKLGLSSVSTIYKCHISGSPQIVHPKEDWCYKWKDQKD